VVGYELRLVRLRAAPVDRGIFCTRCAQLVKMISSFGVDQGASLAAPLQVRLNVVPQTVPALEGCPNGR